MVVALDPPVEAEGAAAGRHLREQAVTGEQPEVAVHRPEPHAGIPAADGGVDGLGGGMRVGRAHHRQDEPPLVREPEAAPGERRAQRGVGGRGTGRVGAACHHGNENRSQQ